MSKIKCIIFNEEYFRRAFLFNALFYSFYFYTPKCGTVTSAFFAVWGFLIVSKKLLLREVNLKDKRFLFLASFLAVMLISTVINIPHSTFDNLKTIINTFLVLFFLFFISGKQSWEKNRQALMYIVFTYSLLMSAASTFMYFSNITLGLYTDRYCGLYSSPVMSGIIAFCGIIATIWTFLGKSKKKSYKIILCVVNIALQYFILCISNTRSTLISAAIFGGLFGGFLLFFKSNSENIFIKGLVGVGTCLIVALPLIGGASLVRSAAYKINSYMNSTRLEQSSFSKNVEESDVLLASIDVNLAEEQSEAEPVFIPVEPYELDRTKTGESNQIRWNLIVTGVKVFLRNPLVGVSPRYSHEVAQTIGTAEKINIEGIKGGGFHNSYIEILAGTGVLGGLVIGIFLLNELIKYFKIIVKEKRKSEVIRKILLFSAIISSLILFVFESLLTFSVSTIASFFWVLFGYLSFENGEV